MKLTAENYYSPEAGMEYFSASQIKSFLDCPARTMAELHGEYVRPTSTALMIGSYVDAYFEGAEAFEQFCAAHPDIFNSRTGNLKTDYIKANRMIERAKQDAVFMEYTRGGTQKILTGRIFGFPFKAKLDFYLPGKRIADMKTAKDFKPVYVEGEGRLSFAEAYKYPLQMAIYRELEGNGLPCYLDCISKEDEPEIAIFEVPPEMMDAELKLLETQLPLFDAIKQGIVEPERCGKCEYCRRTKRLSAPVSLYELTEL